MKQLLVFTEFSRAAAYGIGTYLAQLIRIFRGVDIELYVIYLRSSQKEFQIKKEENIYYVEIPEPVVGLDKMEKYKKYARQVVYVLDKYIKTKELVYMHFNFTQLENPVKKGPYQPEESDPLWL